MKNEAVMEVEKKMVPTTSRIKIPQGLLGFEHIKEYLLICKEEDEPFCWLEIPEEKPPVSFLIIDPFLVEPGYQPDIPEQDVKFLGLNGPEDAMLYNIVTLRGRNKATVNLKGPIVINRRSLLGKQVIPNNALDLPLEHPLPVNE